MSGQHKPPSLNTRTHILNSLTNHLGLCSDVFTPPLHRILKNVHLLSKFTVNIQYGIKKQKERAPTDEVQNGSRM